ncbi:hypothetical protein LWF15_03795 [Kineosporia rhizophila]|uniref:hypothetical protein n=1 Tax=Kineosporia TaxID=49184 RepID=UPI000A450705|nr:MULTISPECIES: hypothetical protein [Kineosporia]MCE0534622.1 hypothetical protein [Kineosporia rhizophila]GLY15587.1 hypothetical protein Kisp01_26020 [Kineosporia sp. NBRC 101677]
MVQPRVKLDPDTSLGPVEKLREPLEDQLTSALRVAVKKVDGHYSGESVDEVEEELLEKTRAGLHPDIADAFAPNQEHLRDVAESIVENA